jgi:hypothetical protein
VFSSGKYLLPAVDGDLGRFLDGDCELNLRPVMLSLLASFSCLPNELSTSLRATGSRECAPDDRLREAIQAPQGKPGLLRRKSSSQ